MPRLQHAQPRTAGSMHREQPRSLLASDVSTRRRPPAPTPHPAHIHPSRKCTPRENTTRLVRLLHLVVHLHARHVLALRLDRDQLALVHNLLERGVDEVVEGVQLLPHQALLLKVGRDDGPAESVRRGVAAENRADVKLVGAGMPAGRLQGAAAGLQPAKTNSGVSLPSVPCC